MVDVCRERDTRGVDVHVIPAKAMEEAGDQDDYAYD